MKKTLVPSSALALAVAALLSACGGGGDNDFFFEDKNPSPTSRSASVTVAAASEATLNGVYSSSGISLNDVEKVNPIGGDPELCRYRFSGLQGPGGRLMDGDIRYIPGGTGVRLAFVSIAGVGFVYENATTGAAVDRSNNEVDFTGAVLTSTQGTGRSITLTGSIPMREGRPEGC